MNSKPFPSALDDIRVATPCRASWDNMAGGETVRFCQTCRKNVYNLSALSRTEAEALIMEHEGDLCGRFHRRADGTVINDNCPVGLRSAKRRLKWIATGFAALFAVGGTAAVQSAGAHAGAHAGAAASPFSSAPPNGPLATLRTVQPFKAIMAWIAPAPPPITVMMGAMSYTPPKTTLPPCPAPDAPSAGGELGR